MLPTLYGTIARTAKWSFTPPARALAVVLAAAVAATACSRTGLREPDARVDASAVATACRPGAHDLTPASTQLVFVVDRSRSMVERFEAAAPRTRWDALIDAFQIPLLFDGEVAMGLALFPAPNFSHRPTAVELCSAGTDGALDVPPARGTGPRILEMVRGTAPGGSTPTAAAIRRTARWFATQRAPGRVQSIVLLTDGAPNCNADAPDGCLCTDPTGRCGARGTEARRACLDDAGALAAIADARAQYGVTTQVIGIDGDLEPAYVRVLERMAEAGGRPQSPTTGGPRGYISVRDAPALQRAFEQIARTAARCTFVTSARPADPDDLAVTIGATAVARDPTHRAGWDWSDLARGELVFYCTACADRKSTRLNSSHNPASRMPSSA
jgi:Mg-chelatase subunit ChlD